MYKMVLHRVLVHLRYGYIRLMSFVLSCLMTCHWLACMWFYISVSTESRHGAHTWIHSGSIGNLASAWDKVRADAEMSLYSHRSAALRSCRLALRFGYVAWPCTLPIICADERPTRPYASHSSL